MRFSSCYRLILAFALHLALSLTVTAAGVTLVETGRKTPWKYLDNDQRAPVDWTTPAFDDAGWPGGGAPLGFGEPDITTTIRYGRNAAAKSPTTYFRHAFKVGTLTGVEKLVMFIRVDDGAAVYLNGRDVGRINLPGGSLTHATTTVQAIGGEAEQSYHELVVPAAALVVGANLLAVEVHQCDGASTDLFLDLRLKAYAAAEKPAPEDNPAFVAESADPVVAGLAALRRKDFDRAATLLKSVPEDHPRLVRALVQAGVTLAETAGRPELAMELVARAYRRAPDQQDVAVAWARAQLLARKNLSVPFEPRPPAATVPTEWKWIVAGPQFSDRSKKFPRAPLEADLDYLETMIANAYSYADRRGADWRGALDAVRASLGEQTGVDTFVFRLQRMFTVFGDPHSYIQPTVEFRPRGFLPFLSVDDSSMRVLAVRSDRTDFVDAAHPYLESLDGRPVAEWLRVAGWDVPQASPQYRWRDSVRSLSRLNYLRGELGLAAAPQVRITLTSADGTHTIEQVLPIAERPQRLAVLPAEKTTITDSIGYLRVSTMTSDEKALAKLDQAMATVRDTHGLVIDVRGNGGGTQHTLRVLLPYFLPPGGPLRIVNVAAYRVPVKLDRMPRNGFLPAGRWLDPPASTVWSETERREIRKFLETFRPAWQLPTGKFSEWHVMGIRHETNPRAYHYNRPVVVLSDAGCFSATDNFLGAMKGVPQVTLLGTASSGGSGRMASYVLPNTKLGLTLCQMASFRWDGRLYDGAGVEPDVVVEAKPADQLKNGGDSVLEAAMTRLRSRARPRKRAHPASCGRLSLVRKKRYRLRMVARFVPRASSG